jgi:hypothetical protein
MLYWLYKKSLFKAILVGAGNGISDTNFLKKSWNHLGGRSWKKNQEFASQNAQMTQDRER